MSTKITPAPSCADPFDPSSISLAEALARIQQRMRPVSGSETLPIRDSLNRINHAAVISKINVPPTDNSAMDGFAINIDSLRANQITELEEIGIAYAGKPFEGNCVTGQCLRIMTGAIIPEGCNSVVMQEQAERGVDNKIRIDSDHRIGENIRRAGEDIAVGDTVLNAGDKINPADLGVLASLGIAELALRRKPVVAFFSTGDELIGVDQALQAGKIYDSNRYSLFALLSRLPVDIIDLGVIADDLADIRAALEKAAEQADLILTTGGVSVGDADYIKPALQELGETEFWKIAIKPGRPLTLGQIGESCFMGLPGNPVAVMVTFAQFVIPALQTLAGAEASPPTLFNAVAQDKIRKKPGRYEFQRGIASQDADNNWQVRRTGQQGSGVLTSMSRANCIIVLPDNNAGVEPGDQVSIQFFDWSLSQL